MFYRVTFNILYETKKDSTFPESVKNIPIIFVVVCVYIPQ